MEKVFSKNEFESFIYLSEVYADGDQKASFAQFLKDWCYNEITHTNETSVIMDAIKKATDAEFVFDMMCSGGN